MTKGESFVAAKILILSFKFFDLNVIIIIIEIFINTVISNI